MKPIKIPKCWPELDKRAAREINECISLSDNQKLNNEGERANEKKFRNIGN